jgi:hypothetical protein
MRIKSQFGAFFALVLFANTLYGFKRKTNITTATTKYFLSDVIQKNYSLSSQKLFKSHSNSKKIKFSGVQLANEESESSFEEDDKVAEIDSDFCRPIYSKYSLKISEKCQMVEYQTVECNGYCQSQSMLWKNEELQTVSCCSLSRVQQKSLKIYCTKQVEQDEIRNQWYARMRDPELYRLFQRTFDQSAWTDYLVYRNGILYKGYYTLMYFYAAICECEFI